MNQLLIQGLRWEYAAIDKALDVANASHIQFSIISEAYGALRNIIETLILSSKSYRGMTDVDEVAHNLALDMRYITGDLSEQEMKEREEWHWKRQEELDMANKTTQES